MQLEAFGLDPAQYEGKVDEIQAAIRVAKRELEKTEPYYGNFTDEELTDVIQTNVFPNAILTYQPEMLWLMRLRPTPPIPTCATWTSLFERFPNSEEQRFLEAPTTSRKSAARAQARVAGPSGVF